MDMLMTVQALQYPLLDLLLDVMLMCCQHLIMLEGQSWDLNDTEEDDQLEAESVSDSGHDADAEHSADGNQAKAHAGNCNSLTAFAHDCLICVNGFVELSFASASRE